MLLVIHIIRYGSHDKVCKLRKQTFVRTDIMHVTEHSIFNIQNLFQLAHFPGTERVLGCQGLFDFVIYAEVPRQCELNKFIYIALGFRVYLQRYPKWLLCTERARPGSGAGSVCPLRRLRLSSFLPKA